MFPVVNPWTGNVFHFLTGASVLCFASDGTASTSFATPVYISVAIARAAPTPVPTPLPTAKSASFPLPPVLSVSLSFWAEPLSYSPSIRPCPTEPYFGRRNYCWGWMSERILRRHYPVATTLVNSVTRVHDLWSSCA